MTRFGGFCCDLCKVKTQLLRAQRRKDGALARKLRWAPLLLEVCNCYKSQPFGRLCFHRSTSLAAFPSSRLFSADAVGEIIAFQSHFLMSFWFSSHHKRLICRCGSHRGCVRSWRIVGRRWWFGRPWRSGLRKLTLRQTIDTWSNAWAPPLDEAQQLVPWWITISI